MNIEYRAAVLHAPQTPVALETVVADGVKHNDVLVRVKAAGLWGRGQTPNSLPGAITGSGALGGISFN